MLITPKLASFNGKCTQLRVGNYDYVPAALGLGCLQGNRFQIIIRHVSGASLNEIGQAVDALKLTG